MKKNRPSKRMGSKEELLLLNLLKKSIPDLELTCNSGAMNSDGDMTSENFLIEVKSTKSKTYRVDPDLLVSITENGWDHNKIPLLCVLTNSQDYQSATSINEYNTDSFVVIPMEFALKLLRTYEET